MPSGLVVKCADKSRRKAAEIRYHLLEAADQLDELTKNVNIAKMTGGTVGVVGGGVVIGAIALALSTGRLSLLALAGGGIVGSVGGLTAGGAKTAEHFIEKNKLQELSSKWDECCQFILEDVEQNSSQSQIDRIGDQLKKYKVKHEVAAVALGASGVLNAVLPGLNLNNLVTGALDLHRQTKSKAGDFLRSYARKLDVLVQIRSLELPETVFQELCQIIGGECI